MLLVKNYCHYTPLKSTIKSLICQLRNRLFGKKSEKKSSSKDEGKSKSSNFKRPRGQQPGSKGHGRTDRPHLIEKEELANFSKDPICPNCGKPYIPDESKEAEIIEVEVKAYKRKIIRQCMKKCCSCKGVPNTITAPMPPKVIPKSPYGISIWEAVLLNKFHYSQPTNRLLNQYAELGSPIFPGTIAGGLKNLKELFKPVYDQQFSLWNI
jgi:transposase